MARALGGTTSQSFARAAAKIAKAAEQMRRREIPGGVRLIAEEILTDVKASRPGAGVPRDKGTLANSGKTTQAGPLAVDISFGDAAAPYALVQHETLEFVHKLGEARYLVRGIERWKPGGSAAMEALKANSAAALNQGR
jgi:hypothetical protein